MDFAERSTDRVLTADECQLYLGTGCRAPTPVGGVEYLGGVDAYAAAAAAESPEIDFAISVPSMRRTKSGGGTSMSSRSGTACKSASDSSPST